MKLIDLKKILCYNYSNKAVTYGVATNISYMAAFAQHEFYIKFVLG